MKHEIDAALEKFEAIAPLLNENLTVNEQRLVRKKVLDRTGWSERTLRRNLAAYRKGGFDALQPKTISDKGSLRSMDSTILDYAAQIREDEPQLSVDRIVEILLVEGKGEYPRSTLYRHLRRIGKSRKDIMNGKKSTGRRFVRVGRNTLWQSDVSVP